MRTSMTAWIVLLLAAVVAVSATPTSAALVIADYNDLSLGVQQGQSGGTGFSSAWGGTGTIDVISGDLTAPAGTGYALVQSGPGRSIMGDHSAARQNTRALTSALTGDTVWFSFLVENQVQSGTTNGSRGGISFNQSGYSPGPPRVQTVGSSLWVNGSTVATNQFTAGQTALVLGRVTVDDAPGGPDAWDVWVDPDVSNGPGGLGTPTASTFQDHIGAAGITRLGNVSYYYGSGTQGAKVDMVSLSDGPDAFADVTGTNPPIVIASYEFSGGSAASSDADPNSSAGAFNVSPAPGGISGANHNVYVATDQTGPAFSTTTAVANDDYVGFTVDFGAVTYNLDSLSFDYHISNAFAGQGFGVRVMNSVTGFTDFSTAMDSDDAVADGVGRTYSFGPTPSGDTATVNVNLDLTDPYASNIIGDDLQGVTGPVEFRFYLIDSSTSNQRHHRIDNVVLQGYVIPEPSTLAIWSLGLLGFIGWRRRKR